MKSATTSSATSSPASVAGPSPCSLRAGRQMLLFGLEAAPVSHSARLESDEAPTTSAIFGQSSCDSSTAVDLQSFLESRLRQRLAGRGSPLYELTWKHWDMPSGQPICALRASSRRTFDSDCTGWPTATATDAVKGGAVSPRPGMIGLAETSQLAGWPTAKPGDGPRALADPEKALRRVQERRHSIDLKDVSLLALTQQAAIGQTSSGSTAETENIGQLNPEFVCWLMGFPSEWLSCVDWETLSSRRSRRSS